MSAVVRRLMDRFFPNDAAGYTVTIAGLDHGGKTTLLYLLKQGEIIHTIPTINPNIETIETSTASGRILRFTGWDIGTGCAKPRTIPRLFAVHGEAMIWVVDSSNRDYLRDNVEALTSLLEDVDAHRLQKGVAEKDYPILILANKLDLPNAMPIDEVRRAFAPALPGRTASIFRSSLTRNIGLLDAFDWLLFALEDSSTRKVTGPPKAQPTPDPRSSSNLGEKLNFWLVRIDDDSDPQEFIAQFHSFSLPSWDHYTHIRIAFVLLTMYGRQKGKDMIFDGIEKYIANSTQTRGRTFHVTMTYFWVQMVHLGIHGIVTSIHPNVLQVASPDLFPAFILRNPYLADGNLWADYYSKEVMMSPAAKAAMVLPDKKPLPNLIVRDAIQTAQ